MSELRIIVQDTLVKDFLNDKMNKLQVVTWPVSYKRFVKTDKEGTIILDEDEVAVPLQFDNMLIISTDGTYYRADITNIDAFIYVIPSQDKDGKDILDDNGNVVEEPAVLSYKDKPWPQYLIEYSIDNIEEATSIDRPKKVNAPSIIQENWEDYKEGKRGQKTIEAFSKAATPNVTVEDQMALIKQYDSNYIENLGETDIDWVKGDLDFFFLDPYYGLSNCDSAEMPTTIQEAIDFYENYITWIDYKYSKNLFEEIPIITSNLFAVLPEFFFPNFFTLNFIALHRFADKFDIELPSIPIRTDKKGRLMYYMELCKVFYQFRIDNELTPAEMCALMFDYAQRQIQEERIPLPEPSQAWLVGGTSGEGEINAEKRFWQANTDTKRGDILIHYEKYPVKAITSVWRAETDGISDPFFWYDSYTFMGNKIDVPHISLDELKIDPYYNNPESSVGKLLKKNFQGVNGWTVSGDDYKHFFDIWKQKGFDIIKLPVLYAPELPKDIILNNEYDVYSNLVDPMLDDMGFKKKVDYDDQVSFKAGRGSVKRPDYCLHITGEGEYKSAKVIIEAKFYMKNNNEIEENFKQGLSYARWGNAKVLVLCDKVQILVYERHNGSFDRNKFKKFYWKEVMGGNSDKFNELKKLLS